MKLSEAIRLGAMATGQAVRVTRDKDGNTCALGAALFAIGIDKKSYTTTFDHFPLTSLYTAQPVTGVVQLVLSSVRELNDYHRWTREQIADWVEDLEDRSELATAVGAVDPVGEKVTG